jgi:hypothetical protein
VASLTLALNLNQASICPCVEACPLPAFCGGLKAVGQFIFEIVVFALEKVSFLITVLAISLQNMH